MLFLKQPRNKYFVSGKQLICCYKKTPHILVMIDGYSRYLSIIPLQSLKATCIVPLYKKMLKENIYRYEKIYLNSGQEL